MGGWGSGRHRARRSTVNLIRRVEALGAFGVRSVRVPMPRGGSRLLGTCPQCGRPVRYLYEPPGTAPACRRCHRLTFESNQRQHAPTRALSRAICEAPEQMRPLLKSARDSLTCWIENPNENRKSYHNAMRTFDAALAVWSETPDTAPGALLRSEDAPLESANINLPAIRAEQARIIGEDVVSSEWLLNRLLTAIKATPDGSKELSRLVHAFVSVSNLRETRAKMLGDLVERMQSETPRPSALSTLY